MKMVVVVLMMANPLGGKFVFSASKSSTKIFRAFLCSLSALVRFLIGFYWPPPPGVKSSINNCIQTTRSGCTRSGRLERAHQHSLSLEESSFQNLVPLLAAVITTNRQFYAGVEKITKKREIREKFAKNVQPWYGPGRVIKFTLSLEPIGSRFFDFFVQLSHLDRSNNASH